VNPTHLEGLITPTQRPAGKRVQLMLTCICDAFFADVGKASVELLEYLGCEVRFPEAQTCCGQPAFNAGDWEASRKVFRHTAEVFGGEEPVVVPSASCAAMLFHGSRLAFEEEAPAARSGVEALGSRAWELCDFIVNGLGVNKLPGRLERRVAFHRSCHSRLTPSGAAAMQLLSGIEGIEIAPFGEAEQCCGFGGAFSVSFPNISTKMGELKLQHVLAASPDLLVSGDMGCLLHLGGILDQLDTPLPRLHVAQVLRDSLVEAGLIHPQPIS
jgi:L-lactate dehydrogenase complex protein LldE